MLFHVEMDVRIPHDIAAEKVDALKQAERVRAMERSEEHTSELQ